MSNRDAVDFSEWTALANSQASDSTESLFTARKRLLSGPVPMTQNFVVPGSDSDTILTNIRNDSETSLATWLWRAKVPLIGSGSSRRCAVRKLAE
jgi:hypothetical protein